MRTINIRLNTKWHIGKTVFSVDLFYCNPQISGSWKSNYLHWFWWLCAIICFAQTSGYLFPFIFSTVQCPKDFSGCAHVALALQCCPWSPLSPSPARFCWWWPWEGSLFSAVFHRIIGSSFTCTIAKRVQVPYFGFLRATLNNLLQWRVRDSGPKSPACEHIGACVAKGCFIFM